MIKKKKDKQETKENGINTNWTEIIYITLLYIIIIIIITI